MDAPIGVFDSGVGGLTVAREIMRQLPEESMIYFGDTASAIWNKIQRYHYPLLQTDREFSSEQGC